MLNRREQMLVTAQAARVWSRVQSHAMLIRTIWPESLLQAACAATEGGEGGAAAGRHVRQPLPAQHAVGGIVPLDDRLRACVHQARCKALALQHQMGGALCMTAMRRLRNPAAVLAAATLQVMRSSPGCPFARQLCSIRSPACAVLRSCNVLLVARRTLRPSRLQGHVAACAAHPARPLWREAWGCVGLRH